MVGSASITADAAYHAFLYGNGTMTDLGTLGAGTPDSYAYGISDNGSIVGESCLSDITCRTAAGTTMANHASTTGHFPFYFSSHCSYRDSRYNEAGRSLGCAGEFFST